MYKLECLILIFIEYLVIMFFNKFSIYLGVWGDRWIFLINELILILIGIIFGVIVLLKFKLVFLVVIGKF